MRKYYLIATVALLIIVGISLYVFYEDKPGTIEEAIEQQMRYPVIEVLQIEPAIRGAAVISRANLKDISDRHYHSDYIITVISFFEGNDDKGWEHVRSSWSFTLDEHMTIERTVLPWGPEIIYGEIFNPKIYQVKAKNYLIEDEYTPVNIIEDSYGNRIHYRVKPLTERGVVRVRGVSESGEVVFER